MAMGIAQAAKLALLIIDFLKKLEEILDPEEKSQIEDMILGFLGEMAEKLSKE